jgi:hypothetical protein
VEDMGNIYKILVGKHERKGLLKGVPTRTPDLNYAPLSWCWVGGTGYISSVLCVCSG